MDYYEVLQVSPLAEPEIISAAYRRLSLKYHPDKYTSADATRKMQDINEAYAILSDPNKKKDYDSKRNLRSSSSTNGQTDAAYRRADEERIKREQAERAKRSAEQEAAEARKKAEDERRKRETAEQTLREEIERNNRTAEQEATTRKKAEEERLKRQVFEEDRISREQAEYFARNVEEEIAARRTKKIKNIHQIFFRALPVIVIVIFFLTAWLAFIFRDKWMPVEFTQLLNGTPVALPGQPLPATAVPVQPKPATAVPAQPLPATAVPVQPVPAQPGRAPVKYTDDFSRSNNLWNTFDDSDAYSGFHEGGVYAIAVRVPNMEIFAYPDLDAGRTLDDVTVNVSAFKVEGAGDWGLMCRYVDIDNFYRVAIDSGAFAIYKVINNEYTYLTSPEWIEHEALNPDNFPNGQIPISLYCGGDQIQFMVNGSMLYHATDSDLPSGDVRMYAGSYETVGDVDGYYIKVLFDDFSVTAP